MTYDGTYTYIFDAENRLTEAKQGAVTVGTYAYDPLGRRLEKTAAGLNTEYLYAGANIIAEYNGGTGALMRRYVYGPGLDDPIAMLDEAGDVTYFHGDGRGTIIALSSGSTGSITEKFTHGPFGELDSNTGGSAYKYTARRIDEETGLYYYRNRYYHPEIGRFMSADPIGYGDGLNIYAYVGNDPVNNVDPWGLACYRAYSQGGGTLAEWTCGGGGGGFGSSSPPLLGGIVFSNPGPIGGAFGGGGGGGGGGLSSGDLAKSTRDNIKKGAEIAAICGGSIAFGFSSAENAAVAAAVFLQDNVPTGRLQEGSLAFLDLGGGKIGLGHFRLGTKPKQTRMVVPGGNRIGGIHNHPFAGDCTDILDESLSGPNNSTQNCPADPALSRDVPTITGMFGITGDPILPPGKLIGLLTPSNNIRLWFGGDNLEVMAPSIGVLSDLLADKCG